MRDFFTYIFFICSAPAGLNAQVVFKTIVQPTAETGRSFPVEYVIESTDDNDGFTRPFFKGLRLVNGPAIYHGKTPNGSIPVKNYVFTLIAEKPGRYLIPGALAKVNGRFIQSDDQFIEVTDRSKEEENNSEYFLQPGEDPYEKIRRNLFMRVMVNKKTCFVGEPVVATFKLYSRLQSKSDIVKNPGFYGFTVHDMVNLNDRLSGTEIIDGKSFIVHTIRSVQLYPLQAGLFMIDPMEVLNKVEFSRSVVNKKTEQEIVEGYFEKKDEKKDNLNTITYENSISTEKIAVTVKPYPDKNKPSLFAGATGRFSITASLKRNDLARNEEGELVITVSGKGNFTQLTEPVLQWPAGIEGFEAVIKDTLNKSHAPLEGERAFYFPFVASKPGHYTIPVISFSFFDTDSNKYKTVSTKPVEITIHEKEKETLNPTKQKNNQGGGQGFVWWAGGAVLLLFTVFGWMLYARKKNTVEKVLPEKEIIIEEILEPAYNAFRENDNSFYSILQKTTWDHLSKALQLSGSRMNKQEILRSKMLQPEQAQAIIDILEACEAAAFTRAEFMHDKQELLARAKKILGEISVSR